MTRDKEDKEMDGGWRMEEPLEFLSKKTSRDTSRIRFSTWRVQRIEKKQALKPRPGSVLLSGGVACTYKEALQRNAISD
jgi:hypothetical protein